MADNGTKTKTAAGTTTATPRGGRPLEIPILVCPCCRSLFSVIPPSTGTEQETVMILKDRTQPWETGSLR